MDVLDISRNLNKVVLYKDFYNITEPTEFILRGCTVRKDPRGMLKYQAELMDMSGRSVIMADLNNITEKE